MDLKKQFDEGDTTNYQTNGEFDLVSFEAIRHNQYYSCCVEPYPDITYIIKLRRRPMFYVFNLILPCLLINGIGKYLLNVMYEKYWYFQNNILKFLIWPLLLWNYRIIVDNVLLIVVVQYFFDRDIYHFSSDSRGIFNISWYR